MSCPAISSNTSAIPTPPYNTASAIALAVGKNATDANDVMTTCCGSSTVNTYDNGCFLWCETGGAPKDAIDCMVNETDWTIFYENDVWKSAAPRSVGKVATWMGVATLVTVFAGAVGFM